MKNILSLKCKFVFVCIFLFLNILKIDLENRDIKVALCTMGKMEHLYIKEFIEYYIKLGIDHIFIYDDNPPGIKSFSEIIDNKYKNIVTVYKTKSLFIKNQSGAFTKCYKSNLNKFDWFVMVDMDEYVYIVNDTLKEYLSNKIFNKCDFIKLHWVIPTDNELIFYDPRPLFVRFKPPYIKSDIIKSIIRGNIKDLVYWVHSPNYSPKRNITCDNEGKKIYYKNINFQAKHPININKAYIIHFRYKSTEELVKKIKRGYSNWFKNSTKEFLIQTIKSYLRINKPTINKINLIEKELNLNLSRYKRIKDKVGHSNFSFEF